MRRGGDGKVAGAGRCATTARGAPAPSRDGAVHLESVSEVRFDACDHVLSDACDHVLSSAAMSECAQQQ